MGVEEYEDRFEITAHPQQAAIARERVKRAASAVGFHGLVLSDIEVAVGEAVTNAVLYGSPSVTSRIVISCRFQADQQIFQVEVQDQGQGFDPAAVLQEKNTDALGGRGVRLMRALMDTVLLLYEGQGMVARLLKKLPPPEPADPKSHVSLPAP